MNEPDEEQVAKMLLELMSGESTYACGCVMKAVGGRVWVSPCAELTTWPAGGHIAIHEAPRDVPTGMGMFYLSHFMANRIVKNSVVDKMIAKT
jgi:hypothetical protein